MMHRKTWEEKYGPIPVTHEINHLCKNRACCNTDHLECIERSAHRSKDNAQRYKKRELAILEFVAQNQHLTQREIGKTFGLTQACIHNMLKRNNMAKPNPRHKQKGTTYG